MVPGLSPEAVLLGAVEAALVELDLPSSSQQQFFLTPPCLSSEDPQLLVDLQSEL